MFESKISMKSCLITYPSKNIFESKILSANLVLETWNTLANYNLNMYLQVTLLLHGKKKLVYVEQHLDYWC